MVTWSVAKTVQDYRYIIFPVECKSLHTLWEKFIFKISWFYRLLQEQNGQRVYIRILKQTKKESFQKFALPPPILNLIQYSRITQAPPASDLLSSEQLLSHLHCHINILNPQASPDSLVVA